MGPQNIYNIEDMLPANRISGILFGFAPLLFSQNRCSSLVQNAVRKFLYKGSYNAKMSDCLLWMGHTTDAESMRRALTTQRCLIAFYGWGTQLTQNQWEGLLQRKDVWLPSMDGAHNWRRINEKGSYNAKMSDCLLYNTFLWMRAQNLIIASVSLKNKHVLGRL